MARKKQDKKKIEEGGVVYTPNWTATLGTFQVGEQRTYLRPLMTAGKARTIASRFNVKFGTRFTVRCTNDDEFITFTREA